MKCKPEELKAVCNLKLCPKQHREFKAKVAMDEHNSQLDVVRKLVELYLDGKIAIDEFAVDND